MNFKNPGQNFYTFQAFFINPWSRGKHSWLWIGRSGFKSRSQTKNFQNIFLEFFPVWDTVENAEKMPFLKWGLPFLYLFRNLRYGIFMKKKNWRLPDLNPGPLAPQSTVCPLDHDLDTKSWKFTLGLIHLYRWWEPLVA